MALYRFISIQHFDNLCTSNMFTLSNALNTSWDYQNSEGKYWYLSLTKNGDFQKGFPWSKKVRDASKNWLTWPSVRLTVDADKLKADGYELLDVDYWKDYDLERYKTASKDIQKAVEVAAEKVGVKNIFVKDKLNARVKKALCEDEIRLVLDEPVIDNADQYSDSVQIYIPSKVGSTDSDSFKTVTVEGAFLSILYHRYENSPYSGKIELVGPGKKSISWAKVDTGYGTPQRTVMMKPGQGFKGRTTGFELDNSTVGELTRFIAGLMYGGPNTRRKDIERTLKKDLHLDQYTVDGQPLDLNSFLDDVESAMQTINPKAKVKDVAFKVSEAYRNLSRKLPNEAGKLGGEINRLYNDFLKDQQADPAGEEPVSSNYDYFKQRGLGTYAEQCMGSGYSRIVKEYLQSL